VNKSTTEIINILTACGCKPTATTTKNGNVKIKVNAPKEEKTK
jgi:hypothetical protein